MCKENQNGQPENADAAGEVSENWAQEAVQELLDFWEEQGIYIRE